MSIRDVSSAAEVKRLTRQDLNRYIVEAEKEAGREFWRQQEVEGRMTYEEFREGFRKTIRLSEIEKNLHQDVKKDGNDTPNTTS